GDGRPQARLAGRDLLAHVRHVQALDVARLLEGGDGDLRLVGVYVDLQRCLVADHEHGVADLLQSRYERARIESRARDDEVRAVPESAVEVMWTGCPRRPVLRQP